MLSALLLLSLSVPLQEAPVDEESARRRAGAEGVRAAAVVLGLDFTEQEVEQMLPDVAGHLADYAALREHELTNDVPPALSFSPLLPGIRAEPWTPPVTGPGPVVASRPADLDELAFADIATLSQLVRTRQVSCRELTELSLRRLRALDDQLHMVITLTEERALAQADRLDAELEAGRWRGPLHGIPWGAKDLLAAKGYPTTWGARPFQDQLLDLDATAVRRLDAAGAVLVAKLSLGALAWGDVWFGETTRNPWNTDQGSSGSSAGSAAAVAAGCVPFALGSETLGSIVSPSERCGNSSLRPTFGRVSRHGAMALSWSMDKLGPICRSLDDAALVFDAILGSDGLDPTVIDAPFEVPAPTDVSGWRVGYQPDAFGEDSRYRGVLDELTALGVELVPWTAPQAPVDELMFILSAEAAAAFDELTRSGQDDQLVRQIRRAWPNVFRAARLIPAVEYLQANRLRTLLAQDMHAAFEDVVAVVHPTYGGDLLGIANLTGHPAVIAPCGFRDDDTPFGITFTGRLFDEARLLALAGAWQRSTEYHRRHPPLRPTEAR